MKKYLSSNGTTWYLYLNKTIVKFLGISHEEHTVLLNIENDILYVRKINNSEIESYKDFLYKKLIKNRSSYILNLTVPILEMLEINPETDMIDYKINGQILTIKKAD